MATNEQLKDASSYCSSSNKGDLHSLFDRTKRLILTNALLKKKNTPQIELAHSRDLMVKQKGTSSKAKITKRNKKESKLGNHKKDKSLSRSKSMKKSKKNQNELLDLSSKPHLSKLSNLEISGKKKKLKKVKEKRAKIKGSIELKKAKAKDHNEKAEGQEKPKHQIPTMISSGKLINYLRQKKTEMKEAELNLMKSSSSSDDQEPLKDKGSLFANNIDKQIERNENRLVNKEASMSGTEKYIPKDPWAEYSNEGYCTKEIIRQKFKKFTAENEKVWDQFLKSMEHLESQRIGLMDDSFLKKVREYKKKAQVCLKAVRAVGISGEVYSRDASFLRPNKPEPLVAVNYNFIRPERERDATPKHHRDDHHLGNVAHQQARPMHQPYLMDAIVPMINPDEDDSFKVVQCSMPETPVRLEPDQDLKSEPEDNRVKLELHSHSIQDQKSNVLPPSKQKSDPNNCRKYISEVWKSVEGNKPLKTPTSRMRSSGGNVASFGLTSLSLTEVQNSSKIHSSIDKLRLKDREAGKSQDGLAGFLIQPQTATQPLDKLEKSRTQYSSDHAKHKPLFPTELEVMIYPTCKDSLESVFHIDQISKAEISKNNASPKSVSGDNKNNEQIIIRGDTSSSLKVQSIGSKTSEISEKSGVIDIREWSSQEFKGSPKIDAEALLGFNQATSSVQTNTFALEQDKEERSVLEVDMKPLIVPTNLVADLYLVEAGKDKAEITDFRREVVIEEEMQEFSGQHALEPIVVDPKHFAEVFNPPQVNEQEGDSILFATIDEKTDIITSFILENLIVEAISEDHCLQKFIAILGPHGRFVEESKMTKYYDCLLHMIQTDKLEQANITKRLNTPIGQSTQQRLILASPLISESDQEKLATFIYEPVLDIKLYIKVEERLRDTDYEVRGLDQLEMEKEHIIHKMLFDAINEDLDYRRIYGITGLPLTFSMNFKEANKIDSKEMWSILNKSRDQCLGWAKTKAGTLLENEPFFNHMNETEEIDKMRDKSMTRLVEAYVGYDNIRVKLPS